MRGVLEVDSATLAQIRSNMTSDFLTGFANVVAGAVATAGRTASLRATTIELVETLTYGQGPAADGTGRGRQTRRMSSQAGCNIASRNNRQLVFGMLSRQIGS